MQTQLALIKSTCLGQKDGKEGLKYYFKKHAKVCCGIAKDTDNHEGKI